MTESGYTPRSKIRYSFDGHVLSVNGTNDHTLREIRIPPTLDGHPVAAVSNSAFAGNTSLIRVEVPDTVTSIDSNVFKGCTSLREAVLSENLYSIGAFAFSGCEKLETVVISSVTSRIDINSFKGCRSLSRVGVKMKGENRIIDFMVASADDESIWIYMNSINSVVRRGRLDMAKYDDAFLEIQKNEEDTYRVAVHRLQHPDDLTPAMEQVYRRALRNMVRNVILGDRVDRLTALGNLNCIEDEKLDYYIEISSRIGGGCIAYLLDLKHRKKRTGLRDYSL